MPHRITKLLCPTDGSHAANEGAKFAIHFAQNFTNIEVTFLVVSRLSDADPEDSRYRGAALVEAAEAQENMELEAAMKAAKELDFKKYKCAKAYSRGNIAAAIVQFAEKEDSQHIILGSTGRTGITRILMGSVASEVVQKAHCPVTVVR